jgi:D-alanyl-D-alanine carboxypeptidase (penicillin-binding protein 5/6)
MAQTRGKKSIKYSLIFIAAILILIAVIFIFTQPALSPSLDLHSLGLGSNQQPESGESSFPITTTDSQIGQGVDATSFLIYNETTGVTLADRNPDTTLAIASLTKLMTAFVVQKYGSLSDTWSIDEASTNSIKPILGLTPGDQVQVSDLVNAMLIGSANDAATALGQYLSTKKNQPMIEIMNKEAVDLKMNSTHYENPIGFDSEQNYSTANDLKLLLAKVHSLPLFKDIDRKQSYTFTSLTGKNYSVKATNVLLATDPDLHAIKTGFTDEAQGAMITAIYTNDLKLVIIVLGSKNREKDTETLKAQVLRTITP